MFLTFSTITVNLLVSKPGFRHACHILTCLLGLLALLLAGPAQAGNTVDLAQVKSSGKLQLLPYFEFTESHTGLIPAKNLADTVLWQEGKSSRIDNFSSKDSWLKFSVHNSLPETMKFVVVNSNPMITEVLAGQANHNTVDIVYRTGSSLPFVDRPIQHRYLVFPFELAAGETTDIYINSRYAPRDMLYRTYVWSEPAFFQNIHGIDVWEIFYFGILFVIIIYNLTIFFITRENVYLFYSLFVSGAFTIFISASGYGFQLLWPTHPWLNKSISFIGMGIMLSFSGWFSIAFLSLKQSFPNLTKLLNALGILVLVETLFIVVLPFDPEFKLVRLLSFTSFPIYVISWIAGIRTVLAKSDAAYKAYVVVWTLLILACVLTLVHEMLTPIFPVPTLTAIQIIHVFEVILLSMALASRIRSLTMNETIAKAKIDAQAKFLARMSHEIRTPMNGIVGMSDLLMKRIKNDTDKHYIEIIHSSAEALQQIINDILDYSKIEAGKLQLRQESFSIHDTLKGVCNLFELQCEKKGLRLSYSIDKDIPAYVSGDPHRIRQILINLVSNAVKYTEQGSVNVHVSQFDKNTLFQVIDTGDGISRKDQERLFQPFEQASNNNLGREGSTGLGLAICRELVNMMHGEMGVSSELNEGSTFWFALPLIEAEAPYKIDDDSILDFPLPVMNILVAEDNKVNKAVIKSMLRTLGMNFVIVSNGVEAVGYFKQAHEHIDLILMDCEMPAMDGFKASEIIRNFEKENHFLRTPVIALTAHTWHQELQHCYDSGMDELLLKPITRHSVESLLKRYITAIKQPREKLAES